LLALSLPRGSKCFVQSLLWWYYFLAATLVVTVHAGVLLVCSAVPSGQLL
jgi:hypothetical protein